MSRYKNKNLENRDNSAFKFIFKSLRGLLSPLLFALFLLQAEGGIYKRGGVLLGSEDRAKNPFDLTDLLPFDAETSKKALLVLELNHAELLSHFKALKILYQLSPEQVSAVLNEDRLILSKAFEKKEATVLDLKSLYQNPTLEKTMDFITAHQLSSRQILIFLIPILRGQKLSSTDLIEVLKASSFDINTMISAGDLVSILLSQENFDSFKEKPEEKRSFFESGGGPSKNILALDLEDSFKMLERIMGGLDGSGFDPETVSLKLDSKIDPDPNEMSGWGLLKKLPQEPAGRSLEKQITEKNNWLKPETAIVSLAHIAMANKDMELIKFLYQQEKFDPNAANHAGQTPLHSLFVQSQSLAPQENFEDWRGLFLFLQENPKINWNAGDIHGLTPLALAVSNGCEKALPALLDISAVDIYVRDKYHRSLVIVASQTNLKSAKDTIKLLIKKGGSKLIAPSYFNDYLDDGLNPSKIQALHPITDVISQVLSIIREDKGFSGFEKVASVLGNYDYKLKQSLKARQSLSEELSRSKAQYYEQPVIKAIKKDDVDFFKNFYNDSKDIESFVENIFVFPVKFFSSQSPSSVQTAEIKYIRSYHLLLMAIFENSPRVVKFFLDNVQNPYIFKPETTGKGGQTDSEFFYMDPLSEALIASVFIPRSASVEKKFELEKNRAILNLLRDHEKIDLSFQNFMNLSPMEIAYLTGQITQVQELEAKGIPLPKGDLWETGISYYDIIEKQGFLKLSSYTREKMKISASSCRRIFH